MWFGNRNKIRVWDQSRQGKNQKETKDSRTGPNRGRVDTLREIKSGGDHKKKGK